VHITTGSRVYMIAINVEERNATLRHEIV
jgi:hypothetical protein